MGTAPAHGDSHGDTNGVEHEGGSGPGTSVPDGRTGWHDFNSSSVSVRTQRILVAVIAAVAPAVLGVVSLSVFDITELIQSLDQAGSREPRSTFLWGSPAPWTVGTAFGLCVLGLAVGAGSSVLLWLRKPLFGVMALCAGLLTFVSAFVLLVLWLTTTGDVTGFSGEGIGAFLGGSAVLVGAGTVAVYDWGKVRLGLPADAVDPPIPAPIRFAQYLSRQDGSSYSE